MQRGGDDGWDSDAAWGPGGQPSHGYGRPAAEQPQANRGFNKAPLGGGDVRPGQEYQRSGQEYQRAGPNYQRAGPNYQRSGQDYQRSRQNYQRPGQDYQRSGQNYQRQNNYMDRPQPPPYRNQDEPRYNRPQDQRNQGYGYGQNAPSNDGRYAANGPAYYTNPVAQPVPRHAGGVGRGQMPMSNNGAPSRHVRLIENQSMSRPNIAPHPRANAFNPRREQQGSNFQPMQQRSCYNCGETGHMNRECPQARGQRAPPTCYRCNEVGHVQSACPQPPVPGGATLASTYIPKEKNVDELLAGQMQVGMNFNEHYGHVNVERSGQGVDIFPVYENFESANFHPLIIQNLDKINYKPPLPVQQHCFSIVPERDLIASAETGSGKTAAFLLPIINELLTKQNFCPPTMWAPRALIIAPTRELCKQINEEATKYCIDTEIKSSVLYGKIAVAHNVTMLRGATICVATMGRLKHFCTSNQIDLTQCKYLVIDEVDRLLMDEISAASELPDVLAHCEKAGLPPVGERRTAVFSATIDKKAEELAQEYTSNPLIIQVGSTGQVNTDIEQKFIQVKEYDKKDRLIQILTDEDDRARSMGGRIGKTLVFINLKKRTDQLSILLSTSGIKAISIHGDREQEEREEAIESFRTGDSLVLISTAVCERGIDVQCKTGAQRAQFCPCQARAQNVTHVINYDLPMLASAYVHRVGRTGRLGNQGKATSFFDPHNENDIRLKPDLIQMLAEQQKEIPAFMQPGGGSDSPSF